MKYATLPIGMIALITALAGCSKADDPQLPTVQMKIGSRQFTLEVASKTADQARGLMHRDSMPLDHGMIFVFEQEAPRSFWMKGTRINLDILYVNADGRLVDVKSMQAFDLRSVPSAAPAKYAIELNQGVAAMTGVRIGDKLDIPAAAREPARE